MKSLKIEFDSEEAAVHFAEWLCGSGEQQYWDWMQYREEEEPGNITVTNFQYHGVEDTSKEETDPSRYQDFLCDMTIRTTCGRITETVQADDVGEPESI